MSQEAEKIIRSIPLQNLHSGLFPHSRPKLQLPSLFLPETTPAEQHLYAWVEECDRVTQAVEERDTETKKFDEWYKENYLRRQPPGMMESTLLSPSKRK